MLIDAVATLYFLDESTDADSNKLLDSIKKIPEHIRTKLATSHPKTINCKVKLSRQDPCEPFNCIMDFWSVIYEMQIISQLQFTAAQEFKFINDEYNTTFRKISEFRDWMLINSTRNPLDFTPHQRLLWIYENDDNVPAIKAKHMLNNIIQDILYGWHNKLWNNSFNDIVDDDVTASKFSKA
ncbi:57_t:CDS:2, partial [Scutellospora calospora]